jgi:hypothetical protein
MWNLNVPCVIILQCPNPGILKMGLPGPLLLKKSNVPLKMVNCKWWMDKESMGYQSGTGRLINLLMGHSFPYARITYLSTRVYIVQHLKSDSSIQHYTGPCLTKQVTWFYNTLNAIMVKFTLVSKDKCKP